MEPGEKLLAHACNLCMQEISASFPRSKRAEKLLGYPDLHVGQEIYGRVHDIRDVWLPFDGRVPHVVDPARLDADDNGPLSCRGTQTADGCVQMRLQMRWKSR